MPLSDQVLRTTAFCSFAEPFGLGVEYGSVFILPLTSFLLFLSAFPTHVGSAQRILSLHFTWSPMSFFNLNSFISICLCSTLPPLKIHIAVGDREVLFTSRLEEDDAVVFSFIDKAFHVLQLLSKLMDLRDIHFRHANCNSG